ncbi:hypothetical protein BO94DRAFT_574832 [Aspergillus sclerotioniger CBS 115572]|uniref:Retrovirus-related Pol polyprotein from transposon TNT 1-94-like beta-barrel domain-containing protein n=1 Tax=Aspergillus sclerotioniger CBS 115572 TaxID=1450535 RepID=A0A317WQP2_9EURO|nr:hypothetical protein BO94DRAFT_574832 [Aspergillus sclerotioniger CBS 115572]PWY88824.1 hypothetical protein BO94DRAFT_574832 [Aspergillus sclerotioniger CBS 115572]
MTVAVRGNAANTWIYDTGSSHHLTPDLDSLTNYHKLAPHEYYIYGTSEGTTATAKSASYTTIYLESPTGKPTALKIKAYYQPNLKYGLLSADRLRTDFNLYGTTKDLTLRDLDTDQTAGYLQISKNITFIRLTEPNRIAAAAPTLNPLLLHRRLGHTGSHNIKLQNHEKFDCEACRLAKAKHLVSRDPISRTADPTELWHTDVQAVTPTGYGGIKYYLIMINNATRLTRIALLHTKAEASQELIKMNSQHKNLVSRYPAA